MEKRDQTKAIGCSGEQEVDRNAKVSLESQRVRRPDEDGNYQGYSVKSGRYVIGRCLDYGSSGRIYKVTDQ